MSKRPKGPSRGSFIASIIILIIGMTTGFALLNLVYTGPRWVAFVIFLIYVVILYYLIRFAKRFADSLKESEDKKQ